MKKIVLLTTLVLLSVSIALAQNDLGKAEDSDRVGIAPVISELSGDIPASAQKLLITKMKQIATNNGMAALPNNPMFIMYPAINVLTKETTPTAPPMQAITIEVSLYIADLASGNIYSETSIEVKGVGKTEDRAYTQALKNINARKGQFKAFVEKGKEKIIEYYNSNCDFILSTAQTLISQNKNELALNYLLSVPGVCKECYLNAMKLAQTIDPSLTSNTNQNSPSGNNEDNGDEEDDSETGSTGGMSVEVTKDLIFKYFSTKKYGEKSYVKTQFINRGSTDIDISVYIGNIKIIDNNGNAFWAKSAKSGDISQTYKLNGTIIPEAPMNLELEFDVKINSIRLLELDYQGNKYKIRNIPATTIN